MDTAAELFSRDFSRWAIQLPPQDVAQRHRGRINQEGWVIWYLFGGDDRGEPGKPRRSDIQRKL